MMEELEDVAHEAAQRTACLMDVAHKPDLALVEPDANPDSVAKPDSTPKPAAHEPPKKVNADTTHHDTISGTLRIPVKPSVRSSAKPDSTRPDSGAKRPPHED